MVETSTAASSACAKEHYNDSVLSPAEIKIRRFEERDKLSVQEIFSSGMVDSWEADTNAETRRLQTVISKSPEALEQFDNMGDFVKYSNGGAFLVAVSAKEDKVVGCVGIIVSDKDYERKVAEIKAMSVRKEYRRLGIGRLLINRAIVYTKEQLQFDAIELTTLESMTAAVKFYKAVGFELDPTYRIIPRGIAPGVADVIKLRMSLV